ncbi:MAG TPA: exodeoxyribonuclease VII large subunit, partial [Sedimentibacter sp.]|nr:exodeoxyribonuclease VII large subunit [Sedimentibacter sp.]
MKLKPIKVSDLNQYIKRYLMSNSILNNLRVEGEITNIRMSKTGYTYFSLCDESSCISCVAFFADSISKNGDKIIAEGELSIYEAKGTCQLIVRNIERVGLGKILLDLELLKEKLKARGLFDRKRELPVFPQKIGIITSKTGAALKDILKTFESVKANIDITIYNSLVQGEKSKESIIEGIKYFNKAETDVILISRGGGSFEDLNVFNDLDLAMEVYKSKVIVVTGIGHETDRTLTDYVADIYCHTPTAAAERIIRDYKDVEERLASLVYSLKSGTHNA